MKVIGAGKFKAQCLALLDHVARGHQTILVTKRGKPVAKVIPMVETKNGPREHLKGSVLKEKNIVGPISIPWKAAS